MNMMRLFNKGHEIRMYFHLTSNTGLQQKGRCAYSSPTQTLRQPLEELSANQGLTMDGRALVDILLQPVMKKKLQKGNCHLKSGFHRSPNISFLAIILSKFYNRKILKISFLKKRQCFHLEAAHRRHQYAEPSWKKYIFKTMSSIEVYRRNVLGKMKHLRKRSRVAWPDLSFSWKLTF